MKAVISFLFFGYLILFFSNGNLKGQSCELWSEPDSLSDSMSDNYDATLAMVREGNQYSYYVFWVRFLDALGTELVYLDYYNSQGPESIYLSDEYFISNPQVVSLADWYYPAPDTLAFIFYEAGSESHDIYYIAMTPDGFTEPAPFVNSTANETHLRVSRDGSLVWEEDGAIKYSQLWIDAEGLHFKPTVTIDDGDCHKPDIQKGMSTFITWEKGDPGTPEIRVSEWDYENEEWGAPEVLFSDGQHLNPGFARGMDDWVGWSSVLVTDFVDTNGQYHFSLYDLYEEWEMLSEFSQDFSMEPNLFTVDLITDYFGSGFMAFSHDEGLGNRDIYCSDYQEVPQYFYGYCSIDSTPQSESHPQLFMGPWSSYSFDLICIWETFRNGNKQLYASRVPVTVGGISETSEDGLQARVFPNPFHDDLNLEVQVKGYEKLDIKVFNTMGQIVKVIPGLECLMGNSIKVPLQDLPPGIYLIRIESQGRSASLKVVKSGVGSQ